MANSRPEWMNREGISDEPLDTYDLTDDDEIPQDSPCYGCLGMLGGPCTATHFCEEYLEWKEKQ